MLSDFLDETLAEPKHLLLVVVVRKLRDKAVIQIIFSENSMYSSPSRSGNNSSRLVTHKIYWVKRNVPKSVPTW